MINNKVAYTIGHTTSYDGGLLVGEQTKLGKDSKRDYPGGWVWKSAEEATQFIEKKFALVWPERKPKDFSVYLLQLPNGWAIDVSKEPRVVDGVHNLINDATIVSKVGTPIVNPFEERDKEKNDG